MKLKGNKYRAPCAEYMVNGFFSYTKHLKEATKNIRESGVEFDTIVVTGISGIIFGLPLARKLKKHIVIVRKDDDGAHSTKEVEGTVFPENIGRWLFVDDLIDSGKTKRRVTEKVNSSSNRKATYVGDYLYDRHNIRLEPIPVPVEKKVHPVKVAEVSKPVSVMSGWMTPSLFDTSGSSYTGFSYRVKR